MRKCSLPIFLFFYALWTGMVHGQDTSFVKSLYADADFYYGFVIAHHDEMKRFAPHNVTSFEVNIGRQTTGKHDWEQYYHYPSYGIGYFFSDFHNKKVLGVTHAGFGYMNFYFFRRRNFYLTSKISLGLSYFGTIYNKETNPINSAIITHLNVYFSIALKANIRLFKRLYLTTGASIAHFSNGAVKIPNYGLNLMNGNIGLRYYIKQRDMIFNKHSITPPYKGLNLTFIGSAGILQRVKDGPQYFSSTFTLHATKQLGYKNDIGLGADLFYDESVKPELERLNKPTSFFYTMRLGMYASTSVIIDRLSFFFNTGVYLYYQTKPKKPFYFRVGLRYRVIHHLHLNVSVKAHMGVADYVEWGLGYSIK